MTEDGVWYLRFGRLYIAMRTDPAEGLRIAYELLDQKGAFGSQRGADSAHAAMERVIRDTREKESSDAGRPTTVQ